MIIIRNNNNNDNNNNNNKCVIHVGIGGRHSSIWATWCGCPTPSLELANGPGRDCQLHPQIQGWSDALNLNPSTSDVSLAELVLHCPGTYIFGSESDFGLQPRSARV